MSDDHKQEDELYVSFLKQTQQQLSQEELTENEQQKIIQTGRNKARVSTVMISLAILLLIYPLLTLFTYLYYAIGGRANELIDVTAKTIYLTEPNTSLEEMEIESEIGIFSMHLLFDVYKRIGKEDYKAASYDAYFGLDQAGFPDKKWTLDRPLAENPQTEDEYLFHPKANIVFDREGEWETLNKLPDGTVAEVYVSLSELMTPEELEEIIPNSMEVRWVAVDTGFEEKQVDHDGIPISAIGYPLQNDSTTWSPFDGSQEDNGNTFLDILKFLGEHEETATQIARGKSLELKSRLKYLEKNGVKVYGAVITGPTPELRTLQNLSDVRAMKVGEVKLWNWK